MAKGRPIFAAKWWPASVAAGWVLSRNQEFAERCNRPDPAGHVADVEAYDWRYNLPVFGERLDRRPVMLFPTGACAFRVLNGEVEANRIGTHTGKNGMTFVAEEVRARFPALDDPRRDRVLASVWRGDDPQLEKRIPLSHAAWWIASDRGTKAVVLDDRTIWQSAFGLLLEHIVEGRVPILAAHRRADLDRRIDQVDTLTFTAPLTQLNAGVVIYISRLGLVTRNGNSCLCHRTG
jgi:hypothetical protein